MRKSNGRQDRLVSRISLWAATPMAACCGHCADLHQSAYGDCRLLDSGGRLDGIAMSNGKVGQIVWHDLFTPNENVSKQFYESVAGWTYISEHATDFAWGGGESDFILALSSNEAGAGFISLSDRPISGWIPYIEVQNVDAAAATAIEYGGTVVRPPFDVPGVGRNCLLRDPLGAHFGASLSRHDFPTPTVQFGAECYLLRSREFPIEFYSRLFGWEITNGGNIVNSSPSSYSNPRSAIGVCTDMALAQADVSAWVPGIRVPCLRSAIAEVEAGGGALHGPLPYDINGCATNLITDPNGNLTYLVAN